MKFMRIRRISAVTVLALIGAPLTLSDAAKADNVLAPIWTGIYVGVQGGAQWSDIDTDFNSGFSTRGVSGGGHVGFNWGLSGLVVGVEADANLDDASFSYSSVGNTTKLDTDWSGTVRARVGVPLGPALLYATAGYAWSDVSISDKSGGMSASGTHRFDGIVYGVGAEAYVLPNLSVRLEALHFDYGSDQVSIAGAAGGVEEFDPSETVVRAGLTFHLN
jgi:outer membrane immunogenic protein